MRLLSLVAVSIFWGQAVWCATRESGRVIDSRCSALILPGDSALTSEGILLGMLTVPESELGVYQALLYPLLYRQLEAYFVSKRLFDSHARQDAIHDTYLKVLEQVQALRNSKSPLPDARKLIYQQAGRIFYQALGRREFACESVDCSSDYTVSRSGDLIDIYGNPILLTYRQLELLRGLATQKTPLEMAAQLELGIAAVDNMLNKINRKIRLALEDPSISRTELHYLPRLGSDKEVFIEWRRGERSQTFLAKGPVPLQQYEMDLLAQWAEGASWDALESSFDLSAEEGAALKTKLFSQRVHDYEAHFGGRDGVFARTVDVELSESEATYCLLRAFGLTRKEIAKSTGRSNVVTDERRSDVRRKISDRIFFFAQNFVFKRAHFMLQNGNRDKVLIALPIVPQGHVLVQALIGQATRRQRFGTDIEVSRQQVTDLVKGMRGSVGEVLRLRIFEKQTAQQVAATLKIRVDAVRTLTGRGTRRLSEALGEPELNIRNLKLVDK